MCKFLQSGRLGEQCSVVRGGGEGGIVPVDNVSCDAYVTGSN
jgi:hypothetical protein